MRVTYLQSMPTLVIISLNKYFLINEQVSGKDQRKREYQRREGMEGKLKKGSTWWVRRTGRTGGVNEKAGEN